MYVILYRVINDDSALPCTSQHWWHKNILKWKVDCIVFDAYFALEMPHTLGDKRHP
jgi:hypothetical protein